MINRLFIPGKKEDIKTISNNGFNSFILPVENMSIGFSTYFTLDEINDLSKDYEIYLMINKFFHSGEIDKTIDTLKSINNIKGMFIEDLGLLNNLKDKNVILYQNHLNMNYEAINYYNELGIKNIIISNELTIDEIIDIRKNTNSKLYYFMISKNILMYTRRNLLTNYYKYFNKENKDSAKIVESVSRIPLDVLECDYGTTILNNKIFSGYNKYDELIDNIDYFIYNFTLLNNTEIDIILKNIDNKNINELIEYDDYFLNNKIYYKIKDVA